MTSLFDYTPGMEIKPPCAIVGMPQKDYRARPGEAQSDLKHLCKEAGGGPLPFKCRKAGVIQELESENKDGLNIGTAVHALARGEKHTLSGPTFEGKKAGGSIAARNNCIIVDNCVAALQQDQAFQNMLVLGFQELAMFAFDPDTGILMKGMADLVYPHEGNCFTVEDLKTLIYSKEYSAEDRIYYAIRDWFYPLQQAQYLYLLELIFGPPDPPFTTPDGKVTQLFENKFQFRFVEKGGDFGIYEVTLDDEWAAKGKQALRDALDTLARCQKSGIWAAQKLVMSERKWRQ
jgi:hypothetical protein